MNIEFIIYLRQLILMLLSSSKHGFGRFALRWISYATHVFRNVDTVHVCSWLWFVQNKDRFNSILINFACFRTIRCIRTSPESNPTAMWRFWRDAWLICVSEFGGYHVWTVHQTVSTGYWWSVDLELSKDQSVRLFCGYVSKHLTIYVVHRLFGRFYGRLTNKLGFHSDIGRISRI